MAAPHDTNEQRHRALALLTDDGIADAWHHRFCFAGEQTADAFHAAFGGTRAAPNPMDAKKRCDGASRESPEHA